MMVALVKKQDVICEEVPLSSQCELRINIRCV